MRMKLHNLGFALALTVPVALLVTVTTTPVLAEQAQAKEGWYTKIVDADFMKQNVDTPPKKGVMIVDSRPAGVGDEGSSPL